MGFRVCRLIGSSVLVNVQSRRTTERNMTRTLDFYVGFVGIGRVGAESRT